MQSWLEPLQSRTLCHAAEFELCFPLLLSAISLTRRSNWLTPTQLLDHHFLSQLWSATAI